MCPQSQNRLGQINGNLETTPPPPKKKQTKKQKKTKKKKKNKIPRSGIRAASSFILVLHFTVQMIVTLLVNQSWTGVGGGGTGVGREFKKFEIPF